MPSIFSKVPKVPTLELLKVEQRYVADKFEEKVNLGRGGMYRKNCDLKIRSLLYLQTSIFRNIGK